MPLPAPNQGESRGKFLLRCRGDREAGKECPDSSQRYAICNCEEARRDKAEAATSDENPGAATRGG